MMWRAIVILTVHAACALLIWSAYGFIFEDVGLHPLIAMPAAIALYSFTWYWLMREAEDANIEIECYLEFLDALEELNLAILDDVEDKPKGQIARNWTKGRLMQIGLSKQYWKAVKEGYHIFV